MNDSKLSREWWGPKYWSILHRLAECAGAQTSPILNNDEADIWTIVLKAQTFVMPCQLCKDHYSEWRAQNKLINLRQLLGDERKKWIRHWIFGCHARVNNKAGKPNPIEEQLPTMYPKQKIENEFNDILEMHKLAIQNNLLQAEDTTRWKYSIQRLRMLYGV